MAEDLSHTLSLGRGNSASFVRKERKPCYQANWVAMEVKTLPLAAR